MTLFLIKDSEMEDVDKEKQASSMLLKIQPSYNFPLSSKTFHEHLKSIRKILAQLIPANQIFKNQEELQLWLKQNLPIVYWTECQRLPDCFSLYLFCHPLTGLKTENFFLDLIKRWLLPEKEVSILSFQHMQFYLEGSEQELFFLAEAKIFVEEGWDCDRIKQHLPILSKELVSSLKCRSYAKHLLDTRAYPLEDQIAMIHQDLVHVMHRYSKEIDQNLFVEANRFLALTNTGFREYRSYRHLSRSIFYFSYTRKVVRRYLNTQPGKRHLMMRFLPTELKFTFGIKPVVGLVVTICLFDKYEFFEEEHIATAVQKFLPNVQIVSGSFHSHKSPDDPLLTLYVELEKRDGSKLSGEELRLLKQSLSEELRDKVEKLISSVFRIRNEEEVMKNIFLLSQELKTIHDLPQVIISFEEQSNVGLIFTVVLVRVLRLCDDPLEKLLQKFDSGLQFVLERSQIIGYVRKKFPKEANVFRVQIQKDPLELTGNSSLNFYLARQKVVFLLNRAIGEIRDYNGGMILKKGELFSQFKQLFNFVSLRHQDLLENFFYSINPIERQATLALSPLRNLFELFLECIDKELPEKENYIIKIHEEKDALFVLVSARDSSFKEDVAKALSKFRASRESVTTTEVYSKGALLMGYIFHSHDLNKQRQFYLTIQEGMQEWLKRLKNMQILNLCCLNLPLSLDPRIAGDELSGTIIRMLFEGLTRIGKNGQVECAVAEEIQISKDLKKYTFFLRECYWSNGTKISAYDFEYSWKKILSPNFATPFAYFLFPIKNAQAAKENLVSLDQVGIRVVDERLLEIELESPIPYFLELTSYSFYYPVCHVVDQIHPNWPLQEDEGFVCNGPFRLKKTTSQQGFELVKNQRYWDSAQVKLDKIFISKTNAYTAHAMFKRNEVDWLGMPLMHPWEPFFTQGVEESTTNSGPFRGIFWYVFNVQKFPFHNTKIRQALSCAINRQELINSLGHEDQRPAYTALPEIHTLLKDLPPFDGDVRKARTLFEEGLLELRLNKEHFPIITLIHANGEIRNKAARIVKEQWQRVLGIQCRIENYDWTELFNKVIKGDFEIAGMGWHPRINDPIYTLNAFKNRSNKINFPKWENDKYRSLLEASDQEIDPTQRQYYLKQAEQLLLNEMPCAPIFYEQQLYLKKSRLKGVLHSEVGNVDFKWAYIEKD